METPDGVARHRSVLPDGIDDGVNNQSYSLAGNGRPSLEQLDTSKDISSSEIGAVRTSVISDSNNTSLQDNTPAKYSPPFANSNTGSNTYSAAGDVPSSNWCGSAGNSRSEPPSSSDAGRDFSKGNKCSLRRLMHRHELPKHLQFNPYIDTGYRPLLSAWECILSLFYLHNETVNIITHGVPMLYIFFMWRSMVPWEEIKIPVLPWTHLISCVSPWVGSTIYHMFMNHRAGESCYRSLLHLDMFGIWITQSFGALTTVYASVSCLSSAWVCRVLAGYSFVSFWCLYKASHARNPWERRFCFTLPFLMRAASFFLRVSASGGGNPDAFRHILLQDFLAVLGGFVGALRIPEKWIPGRLDMLANSHHIMHVVVVWAVYHLHKGAILDLLWLSKNPQCHGVMDPQSLL